MNINVFSNLPIRHKIWIAFGIVVTIFVAEGLLTLGRLSNVHEQTGRVVDDLLPAELLSMELSQELERTSGALGFFLLSKEDTHKLTYEQGLENIDGLVEKLQQLDAVRNDPTSRKLAENVSRDLEKLKSYHSRMIELGEDENKNLIAMAYASEEVNPLSREISQLLSQMIDSEAEEEASVTRKQILISLNDLRYAWTGLLNEMRLFLAFRAPAAKDNMQIYRDAVENKSGIIEGYGDELTFEQAESLTEFVSLRDRFFANLDTLVELHGSEEWRTDAYLVRTEIGPLMTAATEGLHALVAVQKAHSEEAVRVVNSIYEATRLEFFQVISLVLVFVAGMVWLLVRGITGPLGKAVAAADRIAGGDLDGVIEVRSSDETGRLLAALQSMQANLKERIDRERNFAQSNSRIRQALQSVASCVLMADRDHNITFVNEAATGMFRDAEADLRKDLPKFNAEQLVGQNMDVFHREPGHQRALLESLTGTYSAEVVVGGRTMRLVANPVLDDQGDRLGTVVEWKDRTNEVKVEQEVAGIVLAAQAGDLTQRIALQGKQGFFEQLARGINALVEVVEQVFADVADVMGEMAQGNLTRRVSGEYEGTYARVKEDINSTLVQFEQTVGRIRQSADAINTSSSEIASGNNNLSQRTENQASSLEETAATMEELTSTVKHNADNAQQANQLALSARQTAEKGGEVVGRAVQAMAEINVSSSKIVEIIGVIDEIADQTNLLALNAAIEAARAGEAGRGFAVVASEVRDLAQRSATAAKEVKGLIQDSMEKVETGSGLVNESGTTLEEIVIGVKKLGDIVSEIAAASEEQSIGIDQANQAITQMDEITQQNAALAEETSAASVSMSEQAEGMERLMNVFTVSRSFGGNAPRTGVQQEEQETKERRSGKRPWSGDRNQGSVPEVAQPIAKAVGNDDEWEEF